MPQGLSAPAGQPRAQCGRTATWNKDKQTHANGLPAGAWVGPEAAGQLAMNNSHC